MVHFGGVAVGDVEIGGRFTQARPAELNGYRHLWFEVRLGWNHLLMQDAHDANSALFQSVKDDMLTVLVPAKT
jgi:hypothetical protein